MARIDNTTNLLEAQLIIRRLRHELSQYETLLGVRPFDIDLLKGGTGYCIISSSSQILTL